LSKENKPIDWDGIERDYRAGVMSVREIAKWYGLSHTAINKKAKAEGWVREREPPHVDRKPQPLSGEVIAPSSALKPEELPDRARGIAARLLDELDAETTHIGELEFLIETEEADPRRRQALMKALSTAERAKTLKDITASMKTLAEVAAPQGKKQERQNAAEAVAGKFGVRSAPKLVVNNGAT
jgi:transposase